MRTETTCAARERIGERVSMSRRGRRGRWVAEFWAGGQHRRKSLRTSNLKVARQRAIAIEHQLATGEFRSAPPAISIADATRRYLGYLEVEGRARKTIVRYRGELEAFGTFAADEGATQLHQIVPSLLDAYRAHRKSDHATTSLYHESVVIKQFVKWCVSRGLLLQNPIAEYKLAKPERVPKPVPTLAQVRAILSKCNATLMRRIEILACTGMRVGELEGLRKANIDLKNGFITVAGQVSGPTKTRSGVRRIPIHSRIRKLLEAQLAGYEHELLFTAQPSSRYPNGGHHINPKRLNDDFKGAVKKAGLSGFTLHSLRRCFNTTAVNGGVPERVVRHWMGHAGHGMTERYYALTDEESRRFMGMLAFDLTAVTTRPAGPAEKGDRS